MITVRLHNANSLKPVPLLPPQPAISVIFLFKRICHNLRKLSSVQGTNAYNDRKPAQRVPTLPIFAHLGSILAPSWPILAPSWSNLDPFWLVLASSWANLASISPNSAPTWPNLASTWPQHGSTWPSQTSKNLKKTFGFLRFLACRQNCI